MDGRSRQCMCRGRGPAPRTAAAAAGPQGRGDRCCRWCKEPACRPAPRFFISHLCVVSRPAVRACCAVQCLPPCALVALSVVDPYCSAVW